MPAGVGTGGVAPDAGGCTTIAIPALAQRIFRLPPSSFRLFEMCGMMSPQGEDEYPWKFAVRTPNAAIGPPRRSPVHDFPQMQVYLSGVSLA